MAMSKLVTVSSLFFVALSSAWPYEHAGNAEQTEQVLAPEDDIDFPSSSSAQDPLAWLGANSPYFAGPDVNGISSEVPECCSVQQAAYIVRHGSRFPDPGAYDGWVALEDKIQAAKSAGNLSAQGSLSFIGDWHPVLTNTDLQMSQESLTGYKEGHDLGYQLRARYPDFYDDGNPFYVWANQYANPINKSRVVQTAKAFVQGYLAEFADAYGTIVSVNSTGSVSAIGNSLGPSDACPAYPGSSDNGNASAWESVWTPQVLDRVNSMVSGLEFDETDLLFMPYLCGFESQITGRLSPWCGVFNDEELTYYEYAQDVHYYYGIGPGSGSPNSILFLPFLQSLLQLLEGGPNQTGKAANGTTFDIPKLVMGFLNDNQIAELTAAMGLFDDEEKLPTDYLPRDYLYKVANFISLRGTVAFEILNCTESADPYVRILLNDAVYTLPQCHDGPGGSCLLSEYITFVEKRNAAAGNFIDYCNVTEAGHPETVAGASFFSDLTLDFLTFVAPH